MLHCGSRLNWLHSRRVPLLDLSRAVSPRARQRREHAQQAFGPDSAVVLCDDRDGWLRAAYPTQCLGCVEGVNPGQRKEWDEQMERPAELTLNQSGDAVTGTLSFTYPQAGRIQVPITSGVVSKDAVTFSGQQQFPLGGSAEITFHGKVDGTSLTGTIDMTSRGLFGTVTYSGPLTLTKQ